MGLTPAYTMKGDRICILLGGDVPFVVRPVNSCHYELIGIAYIHGIMHGEVIDMYGDFDEKIEDICLV